MQDYKFVEKVVNKELLYSICSNDKLKYFVEEEVNFEMKPSEGKLNEKVWIILSGSVNLYQEVLDDEGKHIMVILNFT